MTPSRLRIWAIRLAAIYIIAVGLLYWLHDSVRAAVRNHPIWFVLPLVVLIAVAAAAYSRFVERLLRAATPARLRRWALTLAGALLAVVLVGALVSPSFRAYVIAHWGRIALVLAFLLFVAAFAAPLALERFLMIMAPSRLRSWALQLLWIFIGVSLVLYVVNATARGWIQDYWLAWLGVIVGLLFLAFIARPRGLELGREYPARDEQRTIEQIIDLLIGQLRTLYDNRLVLRDTHPKSNGLLYCQFEVLPDLPPQYRVGLFSEPKIYNCWARFSNSEPVVTEDAERDFRGIALKLFDVEGDKLQDDEQGTFDFLFIAHDAFFAATPRDFFSFFFNIFNFGTTLGRLMYFIPRRLRLLRNALVGRRSYGHPFEITWFSCAPYKYGPRVAKYKLLSIWPEREPDRGNPDYLRERLTATLSERGHTMDFMVQFQEDPNRDLIESTAIPWRIPQFRTVARLHIPQQDFNSEDHQRFDESMTFNPWHCLPEHRPIGGINRARRDVMRAIQEFRLGRNGRTRTDVNAEVPDDAPDDARVYRPVPDAD